MAGSTGPIASGWATPAGGTLQLAIHNQGTCSFTPDAAGNCTTSCDGVVVPRSKSGVVAGSYEYRRYQAGYLPFWTPLRFPGQYYDAESDLFENWNRYYDPSTGRYLQPQPLLVDPQYAHSRAMEAHSAPAYSYANNSPINNTDPNVAQVLEGAEGGGAVGDLPGAAAGAAAGTAMAICLANAACKDAIKDAWDTCKKVRCKLEYHGPHRKFPGIGNACHIQLTCWIKGQKGSTKIIRVPVPCTDKYKEGGAPDGQGTNGEDEGGG